MRHQAGCDCVRSRSLVASRQNAEGVTRCGGQHQARAELTTTQSLLQVLGSGRAGSYPQDSGEDVVSGLLDAAAVVALIQLSLPQQRGLSMRPAIKFYEPA